MYFKSLLCALHQAAATATACMSDKHIWWTSVRLLQLLIYTGNNCTHLSMPAPVGDAAVLFLLLQARECACSNIFLRWQ
jgi:hypothetical protein